MTDTCFCCGKPLPKSRGEVWVAGESHSMPVGADCFRKVKAAGGNGAPSRTRGPKVYASRADAILADYAARNLLRY